MYTSGDMTIPEDGPALTIREMVVETHKDVKALNEKFGLHLIDHAAAEGRSAGRASVWAGFRTFTASVLPIPAAILAAAALFLTLAGVGR